jgi:hypothetical protein
VRFLGETPGRQRDLVLLHRGAVALVVAGRRKAEELHGGSKIPWCVPPYVAGRGMITRLYFPKSARL